MDLNSDTLRELAESIHEVRTMESGIAKIKQFAEDNGLKNPNEESMDDIVYDALYASKDIEDTIESLIILFE